jgi:hypothetical protein
MQGTMLKPTIATASGRYFNFLNPDLEQISIKDISVGLSNTCRFGGQCKRFYSVAEHCVLMSHIVPEELALIALMHDAAEAFTGDIPKPLKQLLPDFAIIEARTEQAIATVFNLPIVLPPEIKIADRQMLCAEQMQVMGNSDAWFSTQAIEPARVTVRFWTPTEAEAAFISRYENLTA